MEDLGADSEDEDDGKGLAAAAAAAAAVIVLISWDVLTLNWLSLNAVIPCLLGDSTSVIRRIRAVIEL